ncbi:uncharacterized protein LOC114671732 [Macaca mulatta]
MLMSCEMTKDLAAEGKRKNNGGYQGVGLLSQTIGASKVRRTTAQCVLQKGWPVYIPRNMNIFCPQLVESVDVETADTDEEPTILAFCFLFHFWNQENFPSPR